MHNRFVGTVVKVSASRAAGLAFVGTVVKVSASRAAGLAFVGTVVKVSASRAAGLASVGTVVKVSASRAAGPGFDSHLRRDCFRWSHSSGFNTGTPVTALPGAWI